MASKLEHCRPRSFRRALAFVGLIGCLAGASPGRADIICMEQATPACGLCCLGQLGLPDAGCYCGEAVATAEFYCSICLGAISCTTFAPECDTANPGSTCDDGDPASQDLCVSIPTWFPACPLTAGYCSHATCGDGALDIGEACDDGNTAGGDCCSSTCQFQSGQGNPDCCKGPMGGAPGQAWPPAPAIDVAFVSGWAGPGS